MQLDSAFDVKAPIDQVWSTLMDFERVAACLPGAQVLNTLSEDAYQVGMKVKLGPVTMQYKGQLEVVERVPEEHRATLRGKAKEARGQGTAEATALLSLTSDGEITRGTVSADVNLSGRAAAMGQGVINTVTEQMMNQFATNLQAMLEAGDAPADAAGPAPVAAPGSGETVAGGDTQAAVAPARTPAKKAAPRKRATKATGDVAGANGAAVTGAPVASTPVASTPVARTPVASTPVASTPVEGGPVAADGVPAPAGTSTPAPTDAAAPVEAAPATPAPATPAPTASSAPTATPAPAAVAPRAAAAPSAAAAVPSPSSRPAVALTPVADDNALDAVALAKAIAEAQLREPRKALGLLAIVAFLAYLFGKRRGRRAAG